MLRKTALAALLYVSLASGSPIHPKGPTAHLENGTYEGVYTPEYHQDYFLGVPYAQPPVGDLRFRNPVGLNQSWSGVRSATQYSDEVRRSSKR